MNVSIVPYMGYDGAGVLHAHHFGNELVGLGHSVQMLLPGSLETASLLSEPPRYAVHEVRFESGLLQASCRRSIESFRPDVIHLWTPRHIPARVGLEAWNATDASLVIHYEDDEEHILQHATRGDSFSASDVELYRFFRNRSGDPAEVARLAREVNRTFLRQTIFEPKAWPWIHPLVTPVVEKLASGCTAITPALRLTLPLEEGQKSMVLFPGVDAERFRPRARLPRLVEELGLEGRTVLLYSGTIAPFHDFSDVLRALPPVVRRHPEVVLLQIGQNLMRETTDQLLAELELSGHVRFVGPVTHRDMPDYLALADAFVGAVRADSFNRLRLPSKTPEYMAMGRPVILLGDGVGQELDDPDEVIKVAGSEPQTLADGFLRLLDCRSDWPAMGRRLREKAREIFVWRKSAERLVSFYEELAGDGSSARPPRDPPALEEIAVAPRPPVVSSAPRAEVDVVILTESRVGESMSGMGIRYLELARQLSRHLRVTLGQPHAGGSIPGVDVFDWSRSPEEAVRRAAVASVVLVHGYVLEKLPGLSSVPSNLVVDVYCPFVFENIEIHRDRGLATEPRTDIHRNDLAVLTRQLQCGDYFLCATTAQRDWILGTLTALGRLDPVSCAGPTAADDFVGVVPFGLPEEPATRAPTPVLRGVWPGVGEDDVVLLWGGGLWSWLDPLTVIEAMSLVRERQPNVTLVFLSTLAPDLVVKMPMIETALELATRRGLIGRGVVFNQDRYIPYAERLAYFAEADVGITAHTRTLETHYAFRTRALDYMNAGLPIITTEGDYFASRVRTDGLGRVVPFGDVEGWAEAILSLSGDAGERQTLRGRVLEVRDEFTWTRCVKPLVAYARRAAEGAPPRMRREGALHPQPEAVPAAAAAGLEASPRSLSTPQLRAAVLARAHQQSEALRALNVRVSDLSSQLASWQQHAHALEARVEAIRRIPLASLLWRLYSRWRS